jgi:hypothetical protein
MRLSSRQGLLLLRYAAGKLVMKRLEAAFWVKYLFLAGGVALLLLDVSKPLGTFLIALFVIAAAGQWIVARVVRRLGAIDRLSELDAFVEGATTSWWPNLRGEAQRVGLKSKPWSLLLLSSKLATRRLPDHEEQALRRIEWRSVIPIREWNEARRSLARAAGEAEAERQP